jgi:hypothetical protein
MMSKERSTFASEIRARSPEFVELRNGAEPTDLMLRSDAAGGASRSIVQLAASFAPPGVSFETPANAGSSG